METTLTPAPTATALAPYAVYKDSGVDWIGRIPSHWRIRKMKYIFRETSIKNRPNEELLSVTQSQGVVPRTWVESRMVMPSGSLETFKFIAKGEFAISLRSFEGGLEMCHHDGLVSPAYTVLKMDIPAAADYFRYLFKSHGFISELQTSVVGIREGKNISYEELRYSHLPLPPLAEQEAIARYLDSATAQIYQAIDQKQRLITLLRERQAVVIHQAVTRGLEPTVPLKPSGIDWLGDIPQHWEVKRLKSVVSKVNSGVTPTGGGSTYLAEGVAFLRSMNVYNEGFQLEDLAYISEETHKKMWNSRVQPGDLLFNITGASIGRCFYYSGEFGEANVNQHVCIIRPTQSVTTKYLHAQLTSDIAFIQRKLSQESTNREGLNYEQLRAFVLPLPPLAEQEAIAAYLDQQVALTNQAIAQKEQEIERLREYRAVLIHAAVTGQINVTLTETN